MPDGGHAVDCLLHALARLGRELREAECLPIGHGCATGVGESVSSRATRLYFSAVEWPSQAFALRGSPSKSATSESWRCQDICPVGPSMKTIVFHSGSQSSPGLF